MVTCGKSSCNHYEKVFNFKNKLYNYIRNHECQKLLFNKSDIVIRIVLTKLSIIEKKVINNANNTLLKTLTISFFIYQAISSSSFIYKLYKRLYFIIVNLYMRYALLNKFLFNKITRIIIMFFVIFMQNLYEKFYNKKKRIIFTLNKTLNFSIKQYAIR